jgi:hypothetical protein
MKIYNKKIKSFKSHYVVFKYLLLRNIFKLRKINKKYELLSSNYLGYFSDKIN